jgi:hypothetical protein
MRLARASLADKIPAASCKGYFFTAPNCSSSSLSRPLSAPLSRMSVPETTDKGCDKGCDKGPKSELLGQALHGDVVASLL